MSRQLSFQKYLNKVKDISIEFERAPDFKDLNSVFYQLEIDEQDLTVWIDPLDGSKGFSEGHLDHVTTLIGVSVKDRPRLGIVHKPFCTYPNPG